MRFDWDGRKAASNLLEHHVRFEDAITAFDDPFALMAPDPKHSTATEERRWLIGESDVGGSRTASTASSVRGAQAGRRYPAMTRPRAFPFEGARRLTARETEGARKAIERKLGKKRPRRGRPPKGLDKYQPVSIRLHPSVIAWAKREAKRRGLGYQTVINEALLKATA